MPGLCSKCLGPAVISDISGGGAGQEARPPGGTRSELTARPNILTSPPPPHFPALAGGGDVTEALPPLVPPPRSQGTRRQSAAVRSRKREPGGLGAKLVLGMFAERSRNAPG